jgi:hypothetical protein
MEAVATPDRSVDEVRQRSIEAGIGGDDPTKERGDAPARPDRSGRLFGSAIAKNESKKIAPGRGKVCRPGVPSLPPPHRHASRPDPLRDWNTCRVGIPVVMIAAHLSGLSRPEIAGHGPRPKSTAARQPSSRLRDEITTARRIA